MEFKPSIFIATPMYQGMCHGAFCNTIVQTFYRLTQEGYHVEYKFELNDALITRARNNLVHYFLYNTQCSHLLFIDADIAADPDHILRMVNEEKDIVCGMYPMKMINWNWVKQAVEQGAQPGHLSSISTQYVFDLIENSNSNDSLHEAIHAGTGYMLISRRVFEQLKPHSLTYKVNKEFMGDKQTEITAYFQTGIDPIESDLLSEDYHFCKEWRRIGGKIYIAPYAVAKHFGMHCYG